MIINVIAFATIAWRSTRFESPSSTFTIALETNYDDDGLPADTVLITSLGSGTRTYRKRSRRNRTLISVFDARSGIELEWATGMDKIFTSRENWADPSPVKNQVPEQVNRTKLRTIAGVLCFPTTIGQGSTELTLWSRNNDPSKLQAMFWTKEHKLRNSLIVVEVRTGTKHDISQFAFPKKYPVKKPNKLELSKLHRLFRIVPRLS